ncbi:MAG: hypothetical protein ABII07_06040 [Patescibacteria group bacterium]|nr:hypothetical protein [Patescibacteria group bacterium]
MKFLEFQKKMQSYPIFTNQDLRLIFPEENKNTVNKQLSLWTKQKKLIKLKNGLHVLAPDYTKHELLPEEIAAKLYGPSYISLRYALSLYGLIPEAVFDITSVTVKPTRNFNTSLGTFTYKTIKQPCFFGFSPRGNSKMPAYMASPEKAVADFLYFNTHRLVPDFQTWEDLRLQNLDTLDFQLLTQFAKKLNNKKLTLLIRNLKKYAASN